MRYASIPRPLRLAWWFLYLYAPRFRSPVVFRHFPFSDVLRSARLCDRLELEERGTL